MNPVDTDTLLDLVQTLCETIKIKFKVTDLDADIKEAVMGFDDVFNFYADGDDISGLAVLLTEMSKIKHFAARTLSNGWIVERLDIDAEDD